MESEDREWELEEGGIGVEYRILLQLASKSSFSYNNNIRKLDCQPGMSVHHTLLTTMLNRNLRRLHPTNSLKSVTLFLCKQGYPE